MEIGIHLRNLRIYKNKLNSSKDKIIANWVNNRDVASVFSFHNINKTHFEKKYAYPVFDYFMSIIDDEDKINNCPIMMELIELFRDKRLKYSQIFTICIHFRESVIKELIEQNIVNNDIYSSVCYVFNFNYTGLLNAYDSFFDNRFNQKIR